MRLEDYVTTDVAAEMLGLRVDTIRKAVFDDKLAAVLVGRTWLIERSEVERYRRESLGKGGWSTEEDRNKRQESYRKGWEGEQGERRREQLRQAAIERNTKKKQQQQ